jgi:hypothetical protein
VVTGRDSFDVTGAAEAIHRSARNVGSRGLVMQAQSAVDIALWATRTAPVTSRHAAAAVAMLLAGLGAHLLGRGVVGGALLAGAGMALMWPLKPCI